MKYIGTLIFAFLLGQTLFAQQNTYLNPEGIPAGSGYSQVVIAEGSKMVFVSGQVPVNAEGEIVGKKDFQQQLTQVFENLKIALAAAGADFDDVVKMNYYIVNYKAKKHLDIIRNTRKKYLSAENPPASTWAGVQGLYHPDVLIEIEAIAVLQ